ncbi:MAG: riboflavin synthase [Candidatus Aminicenantes bacterium]|nr:riboflavin synthase [Candidatus Aminicenantes bacterium]
MFTGIIHHQGRFLGYGRARQDLILESEALAARMSTGDSLSVNGVCLTLASKSRSRLTFNLSRETLSLTTLGGLAVGSPLNLELPLTLETPLSGHLVTGHVDFKGKVVRVTERRPGWRMSVSLTPEARPLVVTKGSVAVDGVSLTVASVGTSSFEVELIPVTLRDTTLGRLRSGDAVNVECDILGKYVYNRLRTGQR